MPEGAVSWRSVLQRTIALSMAKAECMAAAAAAREALWMHKLLVDLGVAERVPRILSNSQSALALAHNPWTMSRRSNHIVVLHCFVLEKGGHARAEAPGRSGR
jgi:hypothetical protein